MTVTRRQTTYSLDAALSGAQVGQMAATAARAARDALIRSGAATPGYTVAVSGVEGADETTVRIGGSIVYKFNLLSQAAAYALTFLRASTPVLTGRLLGSWVVLADGTPFGDDPRMIPAGVGEILIVNVQPYWRTVDQNAGRLRLPDPLSDMARMATNKRFPTVQATRTFLSLPNNYILKRGTPDKRTGKLRGGRRKGDPMSYPAVSIVAK